MYTVNEDDCVGCGGCLNGYDPKVGNGCKTGALTVAGGKATIDQGKCVQCGVCADLCALGAIHETGVDS